MIENEFKVLTKFTETVDERAVSKDYVYINRSSEVFKSFWNQKHYLPWRRPVVRIEYQGRKIWRRLYSSNAVKGTKDEIYLDWEGAKALLDKLDDDKHMLSFKKGSSFMYYWNHFDMPVRCSYKVGILFGAIGIISLIISIIPFF